MPNRNLTALDQRVNMEVHAFSLSVKAFAERMTALTLYAGEEAKEARIQQVAAFLMDAYGFVDALDHRTTTEVGGTPEIQHFLQDNREVVRDWKANPQPTETEE